MCGWETLCYYFATTRLCVRVFPGFEGPMNKFHLMLQIKVQFWPGN